MKRALLVTTSIIYFAIFASAQSETPTPSPTPLPRIDLIEEQKKLIEKETELLEARTKYLKAYADAAGASSATRDTTGGKTTFQLDKEPILETIALSYEAVDEIAGRVDTRIKPFMGNYDRVVLFYEPDFLALSRYRLYREEAKLALANYEALIKAVEEEAKKQDAEKDVGIESIDRSGGGLITALSMPGIVGAAVKSVADLISLFRTDTTISESINVIDTKSLNAVIAGKLLGNQSGKIIYNPEQFVPEYDIGIGDPNSFYQTVSRLRASAGYVDYLMEAIDHLPPKQQRSEGTARLVASIRIVKRQLDLLAFKIEQDPIPETPAERAAYTEFRSMVRAEKLDRFLNAATGRTGILKVRLLTSGGSRRESRNLLLGTKTDYSGSAVIELALYDTDGTMRISKVMLHHTGFRKFRTQKVKP